MKRQMQEPATFKKCTMETNSNLQLIERHTISDIVFTQSIASTLKQPLVEQIIHNLSYLGFRTILFL